MGSVSPCEKKSKIDHAAQSLCRNLAPLRVLHSSFSPSLLRLLILNHLPSLSPSPLHFPTSPTSPHPGAMNSSPECVSKDVAHSHSSAPFNPVTGPRAAPLVSFRTQGPVRASPSVSLRGAWQCPEGQSPVVGRSATLFRVQTPSLRLCS